MGYSLEGGPVSLGLVCGPGLPSDARAARAFAEAAVETGIRLIDVGEAKHPEIRRLFREMRSLTELGLIARIGELSGGTVTGVVEEIRRTLAVDRLDYCLVRADHGDVRESLYDLVATGLVEMAGVWDPPADFLTAWQAGVGSVISLQSDLLGLDRLKPFLRAAQGRPVFLRWDYRLPPNDGTVPTSVRAAAKAAGLSLQTLGLGIPIYTHGVSAIQLSADNPDEVLDIVRSAASVNPDSFLMRDFLDSGIMKANLC